MEYHLSRIQTKDFEGDGDFGKGRKYIQFNGGDLDVKTDKLQ